MNADVRPSPPEGSLAHDPLVALARAAVETYVRHRRQVEPPDLPADLPQRAGAFVSIKTKGGALRGCIGTLLPTQKSLALEIIHNAIAAASNDPRFPPVSPQELPDLSYSVDVVGPLEPVTDPQELDPKRYGVMVVSGNRRGVLLPDLEGVDTVEQQLAIARAKAFIMPDEPAQLYRFQVQRHG